MKGKVLRKTFMKNTSTYYSVPIKETFKNKRDK